MGNYKQLRKFSSGELLFDEVETRIVLKFIFDPIDYEQIDSIAVSDSLRGFAQALLLEAIDASYAIGYVEALFRSSADPSKSAVRIIKDFGKEAAAHWFKHATVHDLMDVKVYQFVLNELARRFRMTLQSDFASVSDINKRFGAFLAYQKPTHGILTVWG